MNISDAILGDKAFGADTTQSMLDLSYGGQNGYAVNLPELQANQAYVRKQIVPVLLRAPKFFNYMPNPEKWYQALKALVELHVETIEGLNAGLTVDTDTVIVGGAGEMQDEYTDVKRARTEPVLGWTEKYGRPIQTLLEYWITYGMADPDTKFALAGTLDGTRPDDNLAEMYTMSMLFFEPDPYHRKIVKSWVVTNMFPKETGPIEGRRDKSAAGELLKLSIPFTGVAQYNLGSNVFAQGILDSMNLTNAVPYLRPSFITAVDSTISGAEGGYEKGAETIGTNAITSVAG